MFVEMLDFDARSAVFSDFYAATKKALIEVFGKSDNEAQALLEALGQRFADAPDSEQNLLLHNDPVALASTLAEVPWSNVDSVRLESFNRRRRQLDTDTR